MFLEMLFLVTKRYEQLKIVLMDEYISKHGLYIHWSATQTDRGGRV